MLSLFFRRAALLLGLLLSACTPAPSLLSIEVRTQLVPGPDFDRVVVTLFTAGSTRDGSAVQEGGIESAAHFGQAFLEGVRIEPGFQVANGEHVVRVQLLRPNGGALLIERWVVANVRGTTSVLITLDRDCVTVMCPTVGSPALTECLGGVCVDPRCNPGDPELQSFCPEEAFCHADPDCTPLAACAEGRCADGFCRVAGRETGPDLCDAASYCDPDRGCLALPAMPDDGGAGDAGVEDDGAVAPAEICDNALDDDDDGAFDCDDVDCAPDVACARVETLCTDTLDDDGDGFTDCADPDCTGDVSCVPETNCADTLDDDRDGRIDCADSDCASDPTCTAETACGDAADDDGDGFADCLDTDCASDPHCMPETACRNGIDDDTDAFTDCADFDCASDATCHPETDCGNGADDDLDGDVDCADLDCVSDASCVESSHCGDGLDNDGDGDVDCSDVDCAGIPPCLAGPEVCNDLVDNDANGYTDCADPQCDTIMPCGGGPACATAGDAPLVPGDFGLPASGLALWLRADHGLPTPLAIGNEVCFWEDAAGSARTFDAPPGLRPTFSSFDSLPYVTFQSGDLMRRQDLLGIAGTSGRTFVVVTRVDGTPSMPLFVQRGRIAYSVTIGLVIPPSPMSAFVYGGAYGDSASRYVTPAPVGGGTHWQTLAIETLGGAFDATFHHYVDGAELAIAPAPEAVSSIVGTPSASTVTAIGPNRGGGDVHVAEILVYARELLTSELASVHAYLLTRYGTAVTP